jgi:hypothetical protein
MKDALQELSEFLKVEKNTLEEVLRKSILTTVVDKKERPVTDEEFTIYVSVCNRYKLNPFTKEVNALVDKQGKLIPVVSTDGWSRMITNHPDYLSHHYEYANEIKTMDGAQPCPAWMEIHIEKKNGKEVIVREYLDECYVYRPFTNPWKTHTKRMLRHKTKIQGGREAFGICGVYDRDEAERIIQQQIQEVEEIPMPKPKKELEKREEKEVIKKEDKKVKKSKQIDEDKQEDKQSKQIDENKQEDKQSKQIELEIGGKEEQIMFSKVSEQIKEMQLNENLCQEYLINCWKCKDKVELLSQKEKLLAFCKFFDELYRLHQKGTNKKDIEEKIRFQIKKAQNLK